MYREAGESNLIDFTLDGESEVVKVLAQDVQYDVVKGNIIHIDFLQIRMGVEMTATISINFVGESLAVKGLGGTLSTPHDTVNIKCLPKDLVGSIDVDISILKTFEDSIHVKDLPLPAGIVATDKEGTLIAKVTAPLTEAQLEAMEETASADVAAVEVDGEKKEGEEDSTEEGEKKDGDKKEGEKKEGEKKEEGKKDEGKK